MPERIVCAAERDLFAVAKFLVRWDMAILGCAIWRPSAGRLEFSKFRVYLTWPLCPCYSASCRKISLESDSQLLIMAENFFLNGGRPPSCIFKNHIWSCDCHRVLNLHLCAKFHQNRMIFRWDMTISGFSRWRISAILNFRGLTMGSLQSQCRTCYWASIRQ